MSSTQQVEQLERALRHHGVGAVDVAFVLGSGLGAFAERIERARVIPYAEIDGMPTSAVKGHAGRLVVGELGGVRVLAQQGRVHLYEGWSVSEVTRAVRAIARLGCRRFVLTNAAGGIRHQWRPGLLMTIRDHINLQGRSPLTRAESGYARPYDEGLSQTLHAIARERGIALESGVYAGLLGPNYETPAEIRMLAKLGADAVGMSTVAEALAARASGARVAGISLITNQAAGITGEPLSHAEVMAAGREAAGRFSDLLQHAAARLAG
ncbi:MAG: purine-nucleoside phosphorylase [Planctomycetes bacterium]|nr:purine-nucleoside phosphorylase [Planctomycetota bacterium]